MYIPITFPTPWGNFWSWKSFFFVLWSEEIDVLKPKMRTTLQHLYFAMISFPIFFFISQVVIGQYRLQFDCNDQQDSHEFLVFLLDWLHNDLKKVNIPRHQYFVIIFIIFSPSKFIILIMVFLLRQGVDYYSGNLSIARKQWFKSLNNGESIISELFMGQLKSSIICTTCNNSSITYETFNSLTLSLPNTNRCTLDVSFQCFFFNYHHKQQPAFHDFQLNKLRSSW